jgi:VanZ family protein
MNLMVYSSFYVFLSTLTFYLCLMQLKRQYRFLPAALFTFIIAILSLLPSSEMSGIAWFHIPFFDKIVHLGMYFVLAILFIFAMENSRAKLDFQLALFVFLIGIAYGGLLEILQYLMHEGRSADWFDFLADALGSLTGILIYFPVMRFLLIHLKRKHINTPRNNQ